MISRRRLLSTLIGLAVVSQVKTSKQTDNLESFYEKVPKNIYGWAQHGYGVIDNRMILLGEF